MTKNTGLHSFSVKGTGVEDCGTSYAAPLAAKTLAILDHRIEGDIPQETLIALTLHHANVPALLDDVKLDHIRKDFVGAGIPSLCKDTLVLDDNEVTLVFNGTIKYQQELNFQFSWPSCLVDEEGHCAGKVKLSLVYRPPIDRHFDED
mgnify:CR=1 FL=1